MKKILIGLSCGTPCTGQRLGRDGEEFKADTKVVLGERQGRATAVSPRPSAYAARSGRVVGKAGPAAGAHAGSSVCSTYNIHARPVRCSVVGGRCG